MTTTLSLIKRNLLLYFRDRMNVFFSLLGALTLFMLYVFFLGNMQAANLKHGLSGASTAQAELVIDTWMFAGIVLITSITTGASALNVLVDDGQTGRFQDFLVSPVTRTQLSIGYIGAAAIISAIMTTVTFVVAVIYLGLISGGWLSPVAVFRAFGLTLLCCVVFTAMNALIVSFVKTNGAQSALNTIVGTLTGFVSAAYVPIVAFPPRVADVVSALPFAQAGMLLRREFAGEAVEDLFQGHPGADEFRRHYGLDLWVGDLAVSEWFVFVTSVAMIVVFTALAAARIRKRIR